MPQPIHTRTVIFDIDDTLCTRPSGFEHLGVDKYRHCVPIDIMVFTCNQMHRNGDRVILWTSRGMTQFGGDVAMVERELRALTEDQLSEWGVEYDELWLGKPHYDLFICDKSINPLNGN